MTQIRFAQKQIDSLWPLLDRYYDNASLGITKESYLEIIEQLGEEYDDDRAPPDINDFPTEVHLAMGVFNSMPDKIDGMAGFVGKDYSCLGILLEIKDIPKNLHGLVLHIITYLNNKAIKDYQAKQKSSSTRK